MTKMITHYKLQEWMQQIPKQIPTQWKLQEWKTTTTLLTILTMQNTLQEWAITSQECTTMNTNTALPQTSHLLYLFNLKPHSIRVSESSRQNRSAACNVPYSAFFSFTYSIGFLRLFPHIYFLQFGNSPF